MHNITFKPIIASDGKNYECNLYIHCNNCVKVKGITECLACILSGYLEKIKYEIHEVSLNSVIFLEYEEILLITLLKELFIILKKKFSLIHCSSKAKECKLDGLGNIFLKNFNIESFFGLLHMIFTKTIIDPADFKGSIPCPSCMEKIRKKFKNFEKIYRKSHFSKYIHSKYGIVNLSSNFFFDLFPSLKENCKQKNLVHNFNSFMKIEEYRFNNQIYIAKIFENDGDPEKIYHFSKNIPENILNSEDILKNFLKDKINDIKFSDFSNFGKKIFHLTEQLTILTQNYFPGMEKQDREKIASILAIKFLKFEKIFPLLVDPFIEEIFLDSVNNYIYIDHQKHGRCRTYLQLNTEEIESLKTHLILESKQRFDEQHTSLVHIMNNKFFHCRFAIDISPSHWKDFSLDIRKLNKMVYTLQDLVNLNTLSVEMACFLIFCVLYRVNITIAGEVNSGKTTLLNSIDLFVPKEFRKIYIEESIETLEIPPNFGHQLKYIVDPEFSKENNNKEKEIYKLLHRSGDIIILGEILSKLETNALFHCLSAGLRGFQTTHASSIRSLINRWVIHFGIDKNCLNDLGIIIIMKKMRSKRIVQSICEIFYNLKSNNIGINSFYEYNPKSIKWDSIFIFENSKIFKSLNKFVNFSQEKFMRIISTLKPIFQENDQNNINHNIYIPLKSIYPELKLIDEDIGGI